MSQTYLVTFNLMTDNHEKQNNMSNICSYLINENNEKLALNKALVNLISNNKTSEIFGVFDNMNENLGFLTNKEVVENFKKIYLTDHENDEDDENEDEFIKNINPEFLFQHLKDICNIFYEFSQYNFYVKINHIKINLSLLLQE